MEIQFNSLKDPHGWRREPAAVDCFFTDAHTAMIYCRAHGIADIEQLKREKFINEFCYQAYLAGFAAAVALLPVLVQSNSFNVKDFVLGKNLDL